jgi:hypothetical protein
VSGKQVPLKAKEKVGHCINFQAGQNPFDSLKNIIGKGILIIASSTNIITEFHHK